MDDSEVLKTSRRPFAENLAQHQTEIAPTVMDQEPFANILPSSQMHSSHITGFKTVREWSFQQHPSTPQQSLAAITSNPAAIGINSITFGGLAFPVSPPTLGFGDVAAHPDFFDGDHAVVAVIALIRYDFRQLGEQIREDRSNPEQVQDIQ